jgi:hypothetical protein
MILNTADSRKQIVFYRVFYKYYILISSTVCVQNQTTVANKVYSKSNPRNLLVSFIFSDYHFYVQNCRFRALFNFPFNNHQPFSFLYSENGIYSYSPEKALYQNVENTLFGTIDQIADPWGKNRRNQLPFTKIQTIFQILIKSQIFPISLFFLKPRDSSLIGVNQMVGESGT